VVGLQRSIDYYCFMKRKLLSVFYLMLRRAEKGRNAGIEHFSTTCIIGLCTFININSIQLFLGVKPILSYPSPLLYFTGHMVVTVFLFIIFLPESYMYKLQFTDRKLKTARVITISYFILTIIALTLALLLLRGKIMYPSDQ
jgi:hypothetical protein